MTLESIYFISQIVAVIAILASLIFVGLQVRQSNRAAVQANKLAKADMTLTSWSVTSATTLEVYSTAEGADLMQRALYGAAPLSEAEKLRFSVNMALILGAMEAGDGLWRQGLFDDLTYQRLLRSLVFYFRSPRMRKWWTLSRKDLFIPPFSDVIDEIAARAEAKSRPTKEEGPPS
jgi:hypothetical protein